MEPRAPARAAAHAVARRPGDRGVQSRALHPRAPAQRRHRQASGQRAGDGGGAGDARLLGHLDRARQRRRRPRGGRRARPPRRAAVGTRLLAAPHLDDRRGGAGLLLRLCQRRAVAAVPRGPCAAGVPRVGLGAIPHHQPAFRRRGGAGGARRRPGGAGAGLPLRAAAADDCAAHCRAPPSCVLAHPVAEPGVVRHLPVAARNPAGHAGQHDPRISHALSLQELHRDRRSVSRGAHRTRVLVDLLPGQGDADRELSDLDRVADARR